MTSDGGPDVLELPSGSIVVRPVRPDDAEGLSQLYASLSVEDRHLRFFSVYEPTTEVIRRWTEIDKTGGFGLVAQLDDDDHRIVGHASYALLPDGDGDFAITIAPDWRGWLGPFLLDALATAAARRGVPNLEADVLLENRRMLSLLRARGYAVLDGGDWTVLRVLVATAGNAPSWPGPHDGPRLLVEAPGGRSRVKDAARDLGMQVISCSGPAPRHHTRCPAVTGEPCPLASGADVILFSLPADDDGAPELLRGHARLHAGVPVCLALSAGDEQKLPVPPDSVVVRAGVSGPELAATLRDIAAGTGS
jgi:RimJ/RimL family protein N-acetyltransferase